MTQVPASTLLVEIHLAGCVSLTDCTRRESDRRSGAPYTLQSSICVSLTQGAKLRHYVRPYDEGTQGKSRLEKLINRAVLYLLVSHPRTRLSTYIEK